MAHPKKKIYREFSPGHQREKTGTTLARIKRMIAADAKPTRARKQFQKDGLLG